MHRLPRWLGRNGGLLLVAIAVIATVFGSRQVELSVSGHKEVLLRSQTGIAQVRAAGSDVLGQPQGVLFGARAVPWQFQTSSRLQAALTRASAALAHQWRNDLSRRIELQAARLNSAVSTMMGLVSSDHLSAAKAANATIVGPAFAQFERLLTAANARLHSETAQANRIQSVATLGAALGSSAVLLAMILLFVKARRRRDIAESERRVLHEAEERLRALIDNSSDVVVVVSRDSTVLYEAGSLQPVLGHEPEQLHGCKLTDLVEPADAGTVLRLCATTHQEAVEIHVRHPDGRHRTCEIRATSLLEDPHWKGVVLHIWDVSDRKALELELRLAQKLEAVGQLAAGIAHEINTPIQYVGDTSRFLDNSFAEMMTVFDAYGELLAAAQQGTVTAELIRRVEEAEETADMAYLRERIPKACERTVDGVENVSKIVSAMRAFAHPGSLEPAPVDLNEAIRNVLTIATNEYKYFADVTLDLGELPAVVCNAGDINQVLLNLIINAAHAIADVVGESGGRGSILVRTRVDAGDVVISVGDDGGGIAADVADRIFDPFFTTKEVGRGTGQGLALSRTIVVERHGGSLTFRSVVGEGTTFFVRLPLETTLGATDTVEPPAAAAA